MIEADFQREYDVHLLEAIDNDMTWRRFNVLLGNLGPQSLIANIDREDVATDEDQASKAIESW